MLNAFLFSMARGPAESVLDCKLSATETIRGAGELDNSERINELENDASYVELM